MEWGKEQGASAPYQYTNKMGKYNIKEKQEKNIASSYKHTLSPAFVEDVAKKIVSRLFEEEKYRDPKYSAKLLASDLGVGMRHISAVISLRFQQNYAELVSEMRVRRAKYMLAERQFDSMTMEDIAENVGFTTRQSFYVAFYKFCGLAPKEYRLTHGS